MFKIFFMEPYTSVYVSYFKFYLFQKTGKEACTFFVIYYQRKNQIPIFTKYPDNSLFNLRRLLNV